MAAWARTQATHDDTITVGAFGVRFLVEAADSNGTAAVFECSVPANARMPAPHSHDGFEETIYGLTGVTTWTIDGQRVEIAAGEAVCVRGGQIHGFQNHGSVDATFLAIATPGVSDPTTSARSARFSPPAGRRTWPPSPR